jgi:YVTN family beta-propeller protein
MPGASFTPAGLIAVDKRGGKVLFLDPADCSTVGVLDGFAPVPHELLVMPDRRHAWIPIFGNGTHASNPIPGNRIAVVDLPTRRHVRDIDIAPLLSPHGIALGRDGLVHVTCEASGVVAILDPGAERVVGTIDVGSVNAHRLALSGDGRWLYTENEEDASISVVDLAARSMVARIETPRPLSGIAVAPGSGDVIAVDGERPVILRIDPAKRAVIEEIALEGHAGPAQIPRYSPDGSRLLVTGTKGVVTLLDAGLSRQSAIPSDGGSMDAAFHPDGRTLLVANQRAGTISVIDLATRRLLRNVPAGTGCETLAYF